VNARAKLIDAIRNNPRDVRFDDACKMAEWLGFVWKGGKGSHRSFARKREPTILNFQSHGGRIKPYQGRQLVDMIEKYEDEI
jgi:predicted RNA binding protein YcfA (HicA-like mRNA interferase family)